MIIWGTRTKRQGRGFVVKPCLRCREERIHFVAESKTKFTLYFVPTFTTSTKALLICTTCEREEEVGGSAAESYLATALPSEVLAERIRQHDRLTGSQTSQPGPRPTASPGRELAVGLVIMATQTMLADGRIDDAEAAALDRALRTIATETQSERVRAAATTAAADFEAIIGWISEPSTEPIEVMLATAGRSLRALSSPDQARYVGQVAWLCQTVASASGGASAAELDQIDAGWTAMGIPLRDVANALAFCEANGG